MTSGSVVKGVFTPAKPGIPMRYESRTWSGGDSIITRSVPKMVELTRFRKERVVVEYLSWQKTKRGVWRWVKRERVTHRMIPYKKLVRVWEVTTIQPGSTPSAAVSTVATGTIATLIPDTLRRRERVAGLDDIGTLTDTRVHGLTQYTERPPKRARKSDNPYTLTAAKWHDICVERWAADYQSYDPKICFPPTKTFQGGLIYTFGYPSWSPESLLQSEDQFKLINKLRAKVIGSDFNMSVAMAELNESADLIANAARRIARYMGYMAKGQYAHALEALLGELAPGTARRVRDRGRRREEIASRHLEMQYGWKPLLQDTVAGAEALAEALNAPVRKSYRARVRVEKNYSKHTTIGGSCLGPPSDYVGAAVKTHSRSIICRFTEKPSVPKLLGLLDPEVVAWEKVPFSFVADWFIPVGDWLQARGFAQGLDAVFIQSDKKTGRAFPPYTKDRAQLIVSNPEDVLAVQPDFFKVEFSRVILTSLDVPKPRMQPLNKVLSWSRAANAVALLVGRYSGRGDG